MADKDFNKLPYLESVIGNITDIVTILSSNGTILFSSQSAEFILGYKVDELIGKNAFSLIHPSDYARVFSLFISNLSNLGVVKKVETRLKHRNGSWVHVESVARNLLGDPMVRGIVICSRDMSERYETEKIIRIQSKALEAASNGILITSVQGVIEWVNPAFLRMTGFSLEEIIGKNPRVLKSGEHSAEFYAHMWNIILSGNTWEGELVNKKKDGTLYFERKTITPIADENGTLTHFIAIMQDISESKKLESEFRQAQKMEVVGQLAGGVAHDFNNLLTVIIGHASMILSGLSRDSEMFEPMDEIQKSAARAAALTRQLLAFSRKQVLQLKVVALNDVVRGADKMIRRLVGENIEVVTLLSEGLGRVKVDPVQLEQVLMNLAVNARDAMPSGGKLIIETRQTAILSGHTELYPGMKPGKYLLLSVSDNGIGMSDDVKARIFEPFFTTKELGKGTGLGLATVYGIVKQLSGGVYVESKKGEGTRFLIFLPPSDEEGVDGSHENFKALPFGTESILLVEDEDLVRGLAEKILKLQNFTVYEARNGLEALKLIQDMKIKELDVLVTDMVMPYVGGKELAIQIVKDFPDIKIVFTSGYTDHSSIQKWLDAGHSFIQKPYTPAELVFAVRTLIDRTKA